MTTSIFHKNTLKFENRVHKIIIQQYYFLHFIIILITVSFIEFIRYEDDDYIRIKNDKNHHYQKGNYILRSSNHLTGLIILLIVDVLHLFYNTY